MFVRFGYDSAQTPPHTVSVFFAADMAGSFTRVIEGRHQGVGRALLRKLLEQRENTTADPFERVITTGTIVDEADETPGAEEDLASPIPDPDKDAFTLAVYAFDDESRAAEHGIQDTLIMDGEAAAVEATRVFLEDQGLYARHIGSMLVEPLS